MDFKAGKYYVGDLCYAVSDENWDQLLDDTDYLEADNMTYKGVPIWAHGTAYGDGGYKDLQGREYTVDAGIIGVMPYEVVDGDSITGGQVIDFPNDFSVSYRNGKFLIGDIVINTADEEEI